MFTFNKLRSFNNIVHFCTTRNGGNSIGSYSSNNLSPFSGDEYSNFKSNQSVLCEKLGIESEYLIIPYQTHGAEILSVDESFISLPAEKQSKELDGIDAIVTNTPGVCIGVTTADCVPLLYYDPINGVVAGAHAGWRGTCKKIATCTLEYMQHKFNSKPQNILVGIGPSISVEAYEVGSEVVEQFNQAGFDTSKITSIINESKHLDLWEANKMLLLDAGVKQENIEIAGICTYTNHSNYFSARRLGIHSGRMLSGIMLKTGRK